MIKYSVIDTNVLIAANGRKTHANLKCQLACIEALENIRSNTVVILDNRSLILTEYSKYCHYKGQPSVGDKFFKYIHDNQSVTDKCLIVPITPTDQTESNFLEFPKHPDLNNFDLSDRKFVAVTKASLKNPPIYNATDSDWNEVQEVFKVCNITIIQLCPQHATRD